MAGVESSYIMYNYYSCIFQILFECEILGKIPKNNFLPWWNPKYSRNYAIENKVSGLLFQFVYKQTIWTNIFWQIQSFISLTMIVSTWFDLCHEKICWLFLKQKTWRR